MDLEQLKIRLPLLRTTEMINLDSDDDDNEDNEDSYGLHSDHSIGDPYDD
jgi:hypothetical protein